METIELFCCECGRSLGFVELSRLDRATRAALGVMMSTFAPAPGAQANGQNEATLPLVCHAHRTVT